MTSGESHRPQGATVTELVARCLRALETEGETALETICAAHPELAGEVRTLVATAQRLPEVHAQGLSRDPRLQQLLGDRYILDARLGSGAMGTVYAARDLDLGRRVAVKVMHSGYVDLQRVLQRFEREAAVLASLQHPAIVTIHDRGVTPDGEPYLVMEHVDGVPLAELVAAAKQRGGDETGWLREQFDIHGVREASFVRQSARWIAEAAGALRAAHRLGIAHRDIKPTNLMVRRDGRLVVIDFGVAVREQDARLTRTNEAVGTLAYLAPEALLGGRCEGAQQDLYGLAATLYTLWTFEAPYSGTAPEILAAIAHRSPTPAHRLRTGLSQDARAILDHGLARSARHRYQDLGVFESDLEALLAHRAVSVKPTSAATHLVRRALRSRAVLGAAAATFVLALGFGTARALRASAAAQLARIQAEFAREWPRVPANLAIVSPQFRHIADPALRLGVLDVLGRLAELGELGLPALALRALVNEDHGDHARAVADLAALAEARPSAYTTELVARYRQAPANGAVELASLPEPTDGLGWYLAGLHALRAGDSARAEACLAAPSTEPMRHAAELRLLLRLVPLGELRGEEHTLVRIQRAMAIGEDVSALEVAGGFESAMTAHLRGVACARQGSWRRALDASLTSVALAPASHPAWQNAAEAASQLGRYEESAEYARRALEFAPAHVPALSILAKALVEDGQVDEARAVALAAPFEATAVGQRNRATLQALVELSAAMFAREHAPDVARQAAVAAREFASELPESSKTRARVHAYADSILSGDFGPFERQLLSELQEVPTSIPLVRELSKQLGARRQFGLGLDPESVTALERWVAHLHETLDGVQPAPLLRPSNAAAPGH